MIASRLHRWCWWAVALLVVPWAHRPGPALACPPALALQGDEELIPALHQALHRRGIATEPTPGCPSVLVRVDRAGPQRVAVTVVEIVNQDIRREFGSADLAAAFIESWTRRDISAALLPSAEELAAGRPRPAVPRPAPPAKVAAPQRASVAVAGDVVGGSDGTVWSGGQLQVCAQVGPVCLGGMMLVRGQAHPPGAPARPQPGDPLEQVTLAGIAGKVDTAALMLLELPLRVRAVSLVPALGAGAGWVRSRLDAGATMGMDVPDHVDQAGLRLRAGVTLCLPLRRGFAVDLGAAADFTLLASAASYDATRVTGPCPMPPMPAMPCLRTLRISVPAPPWGLFGGRVGLRWSGP